MPAKVNGSAQYGIDVQVPGMVYASLLHAPMDGVKAESLNADEVKKIKGVTHVLPLPFGVAVVADTIEASHAGRNALKVKWDTSGAKAAPFDSESAKEEYARKAKDPNADVKEAFKTGDADKALAGAAKVLEAAYWSEHTYHAQMEPMNAVAKVSEDGQSAEIWVGTQVQPLAAAVVAGVLKTTPDKIKIHLQLLGGGFGRRIWPDAPVQAAVLANIVKKPVKLILTREDDIQAARPRPMTLPRHEGGPRPQRRPCELAPSPRRRERRRGGSAAALPGDRRARLHRLGRDEPGLLRHPEPQGRCDPRAARDAGACLARHRGGLQQVRRASPSSTRWRRRAMSIRSIPPRADEGPSARASRDQGGRRDVGLRRKRAGRGLGIAFSDYHDTLTAAVAEVSVDQATGKIKVHEYWISIDGGLIIQPHNVEAQLESAIVYGLSGALSEELTVKDGAVAAVELQRLSGAADERHAGGPHEGDRHRQPADRHGRGGHPLRRALHRQRGRAAHRQAAAPPADVARPGEEGAGVAR